MSGTASEVFGIESETWLRKTVRLRRTVTSARNNNEDQEEDEDEQEIDIKWKRLQQV